MDKWSQDNLVLLGKRFPTDLVPLDKWSRKICSPYFQILTACPPGQTDYSRYHLSRGTELVGDRLSRGTNCGGPNVRGPYVFGTKCVTADPVCNLGCTLPICNSLSPESVVCFRFTFFRRNTANRHITLPIVCSFGPL